MSKQKCTGCEKIKDKETGFSKNKQTLSGYAYKCKVCFQKNYQKNKKTLHENQARYRRRKLLGIKASNDNVWKQKYCCDCNAEKISVINSGSFQCDECKEKTAKGLGVYE